MNEAVANCKDTFRTWSKTTILHRQQIMFRYQDLIKKNMVCCCSVVLSRNVDENLNVQRRIAENISKEQGKTVADAEGSCLRGLQVVESCCSVTFLQTGETMHSVAKDMDIHSYRMPLGVTAGFVD